MREKFRKEIVQHVTKNLVAIQLLRLILLEPMWGYKIKKQMEKKFNVKLGHGTLYPMLNSLEKKGFLTSQKQKEEGRTRKIYTVTENGIEYVKTYYDIIQEQLEDKDIR